MGCKISYWDCKYRNYEEEYSEVFGEERYYFCTHEDGEGYCNKTNKYCDDEEYCELAEHE